MLCDNCEKRPATRVSTQIVDGKKQLQYRCDTCEVSLDTRLERPCERCGQREGRIKLARIRKKYRTVSYLCEVCAALR